MSVAHSVRAELTWTGDRFERDVRIEINERGRIESIGRELETVDLELTGQALLPGMVNVHSHAFQRGLRGRGERFPEGAGSFWSWRDAMYGLVDALDRDSFAQLSLRAFREMRAAGITTVGEFHYLHHAPGTTDFSLDDALLEAAAAAGIRLVLLLTHYRLGGFGRPLEGGQLRFDTGSEQTLWRQVDELASRLDPELQSIGIAAHSLRAVPPAEIVSLHREARRRGLPFHMHVEEQPREIEDCLAAIGARPLDWILEHLEPSFEFTAVHCTHAPAERIRELVGRGAHVCVCPLTEANLGDGIPDLQEIAAGRGVCLGTDSNARISMQEEMRWLEYGQRLRSGRRGVWRDATGGVARTLFDAATIEGARALNLPAGRIAHGGPADLVAIDLAHLSLAGHDEESLLAAFVLGARDDAIAATCVAGRWSDHR
jgi:formimidoylglutamate deiminase